MAFNRLRRVRARPREPMRDLRHAVPYWGKSENEERRRDCAKHLRLRCVLLKATALQNNSRNA